MLECCGVRMQGKRYFFLNLSVNEASQDRSGSVERLPGSALCTFPSSVPGVPSLTSVGLQILVLSVC